VTLEEASLAGALVGLAARFAGPSHHYRLSLETARGFWLRYGSELLGDHPHYSIFPGASHRLALQVREHQVRAYVDGELREEVDHPAGPLEGRLGLSGDAGRALFRDVRVTDGALPEQDGVH
jgi:hypothetical protein